MFLRLCEPWSGQYTRFLAYIYGVVFDIFPENVAGLRDDGPLAVFFFGTCYFAIIPLLIVMVVAMKRRIFRVALMAIAAIALIWIRVNLMNAVDSGSVLWTRKMLTWFFVWDAFTILAAASLFIVLWRSASEGSLKEILKAIFSPIMRKRFFVNFRQMLDKFSRGNIHHL